MGNQLVSIAPSQIFPVDHYLTDQPDMIFDTSLGSTRFFKVARAKSQEGLIVVKVFVIHDPTLTLTTYKKRIEDIAHSLKSSSAHNCLPFTKTIITDKAAFICREYVKFSVYDRISTRPFLTNIEKKWIAFQILYALHQCHKVGVCHGDIKIENIMITSWNWILLTDFATFKPTYLPDDNPADYNFFFDTSRRRTCYIAPERFRTSNLIMNNQAPIDASAQPLLPEEPLGQTADLTPAMDIFSAGCTLLELFNEGTMTFDLSQLLSYRNGEDVFLQKHLDRIEDEGIRNILANMTQRDPSKRQSAENLLAEARGSIFPEYFYSFLQSFLLLFSESPNITPDEKIHTVRKDIDQIVNKWLAGENSEGLILIISLIISCIRDLQYSNNKIEALDILKTLAIHSPSCDIILDRIVPFIVQLLTDPSADVRRYAVCVLTESLKLVKNVPATDSNIFPEYVFTALSTIARDESFIVRAEYAKCIATLCETAIHFLESTLCPKSFDNELANLHDIVRQDVSNLLTDSHSLVKRTILEHSVINLCVCFGKQKANDIILSHVITFLNDKSDKLLRATFYKSIIGVISYVGCHCSAIITPLLIQGLSDTEEFVMLESLEAMKELTRLGLFVKTDLYELLSEVAPYLVHPSLWVRLGAIGFISYSAKYYLSLVDVQCKLMPMINPYLKQKILQPEHPTLLLNILQPNVLRSVWDILVKSHPQALENLLYALRDRRQVTTNAIHLPQTREVHPETKQLLRRLSSDGMTECMESYILDFTRQLLRLSKYRNALNLDLELSTNSGKVKSQQIHGKNVDLLVHPPDRHSPCSSTGLVMVEDSINNTNTSSFVHNKSNIAHSSSGGLQTDASISTTRPTNSSLNTNPSSTASQPSSSTMNEEWVAMFGGSGNIPSSGVIHVSNSPNIARVTPLDSGPSPKLDSNVRVDEHTYLDYKHAPCRNQLNELITTKAREFQELKSNAASSTSSVFSNAPYIPDWKFRGSLVAHLHEHHSSINRLASIPSCYLFASVSADGHIRLWDCTKMEGRNIANRSKYIFNKGGPLVGLTVCDGEQSLATSGVKGLIILRTERLAVSQQREIDYAEDGQVIDIHNFSPHIITYSTMYGSVIGVDLRAPRNAWKLNNTIKNGVITASCIEAQQGWFGLGTTNGFQMIWDLRFGLQAATLIHPSGTLIRRMVPHPTFGSGIISAIHENNDVSVWEIETAHRETVLWGSSDPPLSKNPSSKMSALALLPIVTNKTSLLFTAGTDMRIRLWDLNNHNDSRLAIPASSDNPQTNFFYKARLVDGTNVIQEWNTSNQSQKTNSEDPESSGKGPINDDGPGRPGPEAPQPGHHSWISDMIIANTNSQHFLVTGSKDGVIKVWK